MTAVGRTFNIPSALIVGAQKAGTTALLRNLASAEDVWGHERELNYFSTNFEKGPEWYRRKILASCPEKKRNRDDLILIEKSPSYLAQEQCASRIHEFDPNLKIIAVLRNPVDRAYSRYNDIMRDEPGRLKRSFSEIMRTNLSRKNHFLRLGLYEEQLLRYFELFGEERVLVLIQEEWISKPWDILSQTLKFLGSSHKEHISVKTVHKNPYSEPLAQSDREKLVDFFRAPNEKLYQLLGRRIHAWE